MTFTKKNNEKRPDHAGAGRFERKRPGKTGGYKTERSGRIDMKKDYRKDETRERPYKSYSDKPQDASGNERVRTRSTRPFNREDTAKRYDKFPKDDRRPYKSYSDKREETPGNERVRTRSTRPYNREGTAKNYEKFPKDDRRPFSGTDKRRDNKFIKNSARTERREPFKSEEGTAKRYDKYPKTERRPFTGSDNRRDKKFAKDDARSERREPFNRDEVRSKRYERYSKDGPRSYSGSGAQRDRKYSKDEAVSERKRTDTGEGTTKKYERFSTESKSSYSKDRNDDIGKENYRPRKEYSAGSEKSGSNYPRSYKRNLPERKSYESKGPGISTQTKSKSDDGLIRLNRYISTSGICSRREADDLISAGLVTVNGKVVSELGSKVSPNDEVKYNGELVKKEKNVYILLNKPKEYVTTAKDPYAKHTVLDLVKGACKERVFPVGRLDRNTTGVLLLTNDGELTKKLTHPSFNRKKIYHVFLDKNLKAPDLEAITNGIELEDGFIKVDDISFVIGDDKKQVGIEIHSGRNRIVRRIFEQLGYRVIRLDRVYFAGLTKKGVLRGHWRFLTDQEISTLKMGSFK